MNKAISVGRLTRDLEVKVRYSELAAKGFQRINVARPRKVLAEAMERIKKVVGYKKSPSTLKRVNHGLFKVCDN